MRSVNILVADDHSVNQQLAVLMLERMGHRVDVVGNGQAAVDAVFRQPYDLVFMDCQMPEMDGYDATREIRRHEAEIQESPISSEELATSDERRATPHIPIIAMTANAMQGDREKCLAAGMDDYLSKPIKSDEIANMLLQWVPQLNPVSPEENHHPGEKIDNQNHSAERQGPEMCISEKDQESKSTVVIDDVERMSSDCQENFHEWREMTGDQYPKFLAKIVHQFVEEAGRSIEQVQAAVASGDEQALREAAHGLKGMAGNVGAMQLQQLAFEIEEACKQSLCETSMDFFSSIKSEFENVQGILNHELAQVSKNA